MSVEQGEGASEITRDSFGRFLREARLARRLSQAALARAAGISPVFVSQLETGQRVPSDRVVKALATALGLPSREVLRSVYLLRSQDAREVLALPEADQSPAARRLSDIPTVRFLLMQLATLELSDAEIDELVQRWTHDLRFVEKQLARLHGR
jgi:transcriptional regulator with XRE-family HTH domain